MSTTATLTQTQIYTIDPAHSTIRFWVRHLMIAKVHGELPVVTGTITADVSQPQTAQVEVSIDTTALTTGNEQRDAHLKSPDFLDVENFPAILFKSKSVQGATEEMEIIGDLTIKGVTREITLKAEATPEVPSPFGGYKVGVSATALVNREDFGITWNMVLETGGVAVAKDIHIQIDLELDRPA